MEKMTYGEIICLMERQSSIPDLARELIKQFGKDIGSVGQLKAKFYRIKASMPHKGKDSIKYREWSNTLFYNEKQPDYDEDLQSESEDQGENNNHACRGRPKLRLCDKPAKRTKKEILRPKINELVQFAEDQGVDLEDLIDLINEKCKKNYKKTTVIQIPSDAATAFYFNQGFSSRSWTELRLFIKKYGVELPPRNEIDVMKKELHPQIKVEEIKSSVRYSELIENTVKGLLDVAGYIPEPNEELHLEAKSGIDGSGNHRARHQMVDSSKSLEENPHLDPNIYKNYLLTCICPLTLSSRKEDGTMTLIWKNSSPNSISFTRPISLIRTCETRTVIEKEFSGLFEEIMNSKTQKIGNNITTINNTVSMADGKMVCILQGDSGSPCHYCGCSRAEINNLINILQGFKITKNYESCMNTWKSVESGDIAWKDKQRFGQCHKPLVEVKFHAILHWKLRTFDFALNLYYRLIAGVKLWGETDKTKMVLVTAAKRQAIDHLRIKTGMLIDTPISGGGTTNTGVMAERFFKPKIRDTICSLIKSEEDREHFKVLLRDLNILLTITQGNRSDVDVQKLKQLGQDIMSHIRTKFLDEKMQPWIFINPSLHSMCAHSWELFEMSSSPIASYGEQAQEHWNKFVSNYKSGVSSRARQHNVRVNIADVFSRMIIMTHPTVANNQRLITCSHCHQIGHSARSQLHHINIYGPHNEEQCMINEYFKT